MIALEKIVFLKSISFFNHIPIEFFIRLVELFVDEVFVSAGENILTKGNKGDEMYVIVSGRVKVHDANIVLSELGEKAVFGELSALSFSNRVSSVSALTDCVLLKINSAALYDLIDLDIGLAKGIIKGLCERIELMSLQLQKVLAD